jgi:hypothetical protein
MGILVQSCFSTSSSAAKQVPSAVRKDAPRTDELEAGAIAGGATGAVDITGAVVDDFTDGVADMGEIVGADGAVDGRIVGTLVSKAVGILVGIPLGTVDGESEVGAWLELLVQAMAQH